MYEMKMKMKNNMCIYIEEINQLIRSTFQGQNSAFN